MFEVKVKYKTAAKEGREAVSTEDVEEEQRRQTSLEDKENVHRIKENKCKAKTWSDTASLEHTQGVRTLSRRWLQQLCLRMLCGILLPGGSGWAPGPGSGPPGPLA